MTKITTYNRGIIIDGHADTKEECETITLLCNSLAKSDISFGNPWQGTYEVSANVVLTQNSSINVSYGD